MHTNVLTQKLYKAFNEFKNIAPGYRKSKMSELECICNEIRIQYGYHSYVSGKLVDFLDSCQKMARKGQPKGYNESSCISFALGDISIIDDVIEEQDS